MNDYYDWENDGRDVASPDNDLSMSTGFKRLPRLAKFSIVAGSLGMAALVIWAVVAGATNRGDSYTGGRTTAEQRSEFARTTTTRKPIVVVASHETTPPAGGKCELRKADETFGDYQRALDEWESCKKPRPAPPPFVMPASGSVKAIEAGRDIADERQRNLSRGPTRTQWADELGVPLEYQAESDASWIVGQCYNRIFATYSQVFKDPAWTEYENLDATIYRSYSSERGESWTSQYDKFFISECLSSASDWAESWSSAVADLLAGCSQAYSRILSLDDVLLNNPHHLDKHCKVSW